MRGSRPSSLLLIGLLAVVLVATLGAFGRRAPAVGGAAGGIETSVRLAARLSR